MKTRVARLVRAYREQLVYSLLTAAVLTVGYLITVQAAGEPFRSRVVLVLLILFAFAAGWLHEINRPGGTLDLLEQLAALEPDRVVVTLDVDGYRAGELSSAVADGALVLSRRRP